VVADLQTAIQPYNSLVVELDVSAASSAAAPPIPAPHNIHTQPFLNCVAVSHCVMCSSSQQVRGACPNMCMTHSCCVDTGGARPRTGGLCQQRAGGHPGAR
jgi:hypothetical protein